MAKNLSEHLVNNSESILQQLDIDQFVQGDIPAVTFLMILCFLGVVGNLHAIKVFEYFSVSSITILIRYMAFVDLVTSGICIPLEIVQLRYTFTYPSGTLCKITRYLAHFCTLTAGLLLVTVAIERRRQIYLLQNSLSTTRTKQLIVFLTAISACLSVYGVVHHDRDHRKINGLEGKECRNSEDNVQTTAYIVMVTSIIIIFFLICAIAYLQIVYVIRQQIKRENERIAPNTEGHKNHNIPLHSSNNDVNDILNPIEKLRTRKQRYQNSRKLTIILLIGTCISFVGILLHVSAYIIKAVVTDVTFTEIRSTYEVLFRCYFWHSAVNPVIFCIVDKRFRQHLRQIYLNHIHRVMTSEKTSRNIDPINRFSIK